MLCYVILYCYIILYYIILYYIILYYIILYYIILYYIILYICYFAAFLCYSTCFVILIRLKLASCKGWFFQSTIFSCSSSQQNVTGINEIVLATRRSLERQKHILRLWINWLIRDYITVLPKNIRYETTFFRKNKPWSIRFFCGLVGRKKNAQSF